MKAEQPVLVILSPGFPANEADTTCLTSQQNLVRSINKIAPSLKIIIVSFQYPFVDATYQWYGNTVISLNGQNKGKLSRLLLWRKAWLRLKKIQRENKVTGLLSFWGGECALVGKYFGIRNHIPHYCWILGQDAKAQNKYIKYIKPLAEQLIALSDFLQDEFFRNHGIMPKQVIPNGIEPTAFPNRSFHKTIDVLGVGSLIPLKRYDLFVELVHRLKQSIPGINAMICGKGPEEAHLRALILKYSLEENLILEGELSHPEILRMMQETKVLLHPSSYEGFSTVCLEALYAGANVVSFCSPMKMLIDNWHIVTTPETMQQKTLSLLKNDIADDQKIMPFSMDETARAILQLFGNKLSIID